jgi:hypothetical protein
MAEIGETILEFGEIERKICDGEALLRKATQEHAVGWLFFSLGTLAVVIQPEWVIFGLLVIIIAIWRILTINRQIAEIEEGLREYRGRKAELLARMMARE